MRSMESSIKRPSNAISPGEGPQSVQWYANAMGNTYREAERFRRGRGARLVPRTSAGLKGRGGGGREGGM
jgi:hypothetical protein